MTTNEELIAEALERSRKGVQEDDGYTYSIPSADIAATNDLLRRLAGALAATSAPVEVTERERLIADALLIAGALEEYEFEDVAADAAAVMNSLVDLLAAGFRAPAADGDATAESALAEVERRLRLSHGYAPQDRIRFALQHIDAYRMGSARAPAADTVTTVEELDALPKDSILKSGTGIAYVKTPSGWRSIYDDRSTPSDVLLEPWYTSQPLTVLYRPVESEEGAA